MRLVGTDGYGALAALSSTGHRALGRAKSGRVRLEDDGHPPRGWLESDWKRESGEGREFARRALRLNGTAPEDKPQLATSSLAEPW